MSERVPLFVVNGKERVAEYERHEVVALKHALSLAHNITEKGSLELDARGVYLKLQKELAEAMGSCPDISTLETEAREALEALPAASMNILIEAIKEERKKPGLDGIAAVQEFHKQANETLDWWTKEFGYFRQNDEVEVIRQRIVRAVEGIDL